MNTALAYFSVTGHSKKIGSAVSAALQIPSMDLKTDVIPAGLDCLFLVGGIYAGKSDPRLLQKLEALQSGQPGLVVLLTSSAAGSTRQEQVRELLASKGISVHPDEFTCRGSFLIFHLGHPNTTEIASAVAFARRVLAEVSA